MFIRRLLFISLGKDVCGVVEEEVVCVDIVEVDEVWVGIELVERVGNGCVVVVCCIGSCNEKLYSIFEVGFEFDVGFEFEFDELKLFCNDCKRLFINELAISF